jgi:hypothetical protein
MTPIKPAAAVAVALAVGLSSGFFEPLLAARAAESAAPASPKVRWQNALPAVVGHVERRWLTTG